MTETEPDVLPRMQIPLTDVYMTENADVLLKSAPETC